MKEQLKTNNESINKVTNEPIFIFFSDDAKKVRNSLLYISFIILFLTFGNISLDPSSSLLGLKFKGLNDKLIYIGFFIILIYNYINFIWYSKNALLEWEIRQTGMRKAFNPTINDLMHFNGSTTDFFPDDPRNATLYYWWNQQIKHLPQIENKINSIDNIFKLYEENVHQENSDINKLNNKIFSEMDNLENIKKSLETIKNTLEVKQINESLEKFDNRFYSLLLSQNLRNIIIDFLLPFILSTVAVFQIFKVLLSN